MKLGNFDSLNLQLHQYPHWLLNKPNRIHLSWWFKKVVYQRTKFIKSFLRRDLKEIDSQGFNVLDVGCGDGQFAFYANKISPNIRIFCNDLDKNNLQFVSNYTRENKLNNIQTVDGNTDILGLKFNRIWLFSVLQYIDNETDFLTQLKSQLSKDGKLIVYIPINHIKVGWLYMILFHSLPNYESNHSRKKVYQVPQLNAIFNLSGYQVIRTEFVCGRLGIRSQEWMSNTVSMVSHVNWGIKIFGIVYWILAILPILIWKFLDRFSDKKENNSNAALFELTHKN